MCRFARPVCAFCIVLITFTWLAGCGADNEKAASPEMVALPTRTPTPAAVATQPPAQDDATPAPPTFAVAETQLGMGLASSIRWSPDGTQLYVDGSLGTWVYADLNAPNQPEMIAVPWNGTPTVSADGRYASAHDADGVCQLWDVAAGEALFALDTAEAYAWQVTFDAASTQVAALLSPLVAVDAPLYYYTPGDVPIGSLIRLWDIASGTFTDYPVPDDRLLGMAFDAHDHLIVVGSDNNVPRYEYGVEGTGLRIVPAESNDLTVRVWDITADEQVGVIEEPVGAVRTVTLSQDATRMAGVVNVPTAYAFTDWQIIAWDIATGTALLDERLDPTSSIDIHAFSPDGAILSAVIGVRVQNEMATRYGSNTLDQVWRWNLDIGTPEAPLTSSLLLTAQGSMLGHITYSPDGTHLAGLTHDGVIVVWDVTQPDDPIAEFTHFMGRVESVTVSADGKTVYSGGADGTLRAWALDANTPNGALIGRYVYTVTALDVLSPDYLLVKEGYYAESARVWNIASGEVSARLDVQRGLLYTAVSRDGTIMASSAGGGTVNLWAVADAHIDDVILVPQQVASLAFAPDGTQLATGGVDGTIILWDLESGDEIVTLRDHTGGVTHLTYTPGGTLISASLNVIERPDNITGEITLLAAPDLTVRQWDMDTGTSTVLLEIAMLHQPDDGAPEANAAIYTPTGQVDPYAPNPRTVTLSADGAWLALIDYSGDEAVLRVWHTLTGMLALEQPLGEMRLSSLAIGPAQGDSGVLIVAGQEDGLIAVWELQPWTPEVL